MNISQAKDYLNGLLFSGCLSLNNGIHQVRINTDDAIYKFRFEVSMGLVKNVEVLL